MEAPKLTIGGYMAEYHRYQSAIEYIPEEVWLEYPDGERVNIHYQPPGRTLVRIKAGVQAKSGYASLVVHRDGHIRLEGAR